MTRTAIAIPAYDAESSIGEVVRRAREILPEVIVVDDGSVDATGQVAMAYGAEVLTHPHNRGKGSALRTAFQELFLRGFDAVVTLDADGQHLPEEIPRLLAVPASEADLVLGTRDHLFEEMRSLRRTSNRLSSRAISLVAGCRLSDVQSGFRLYRRRLLDGTGFPESRFDAESAVVVRAVRRGFRIVSVPVRLGFVDGARTSHYRAVVDSLRIARAVTRARFEMHP